MFLKSLWFVGFVPPIASFSALGGHALSPAFRRTPHQLQMVSLETTLAEIDSLWQTFPYTAAAVVCGFKASAADLVAQSSTWLSSPATNEDADTSTTSCPTDEQTPSSSLSKPVTLDPKRNLAFLLYGVLYQGIAQEYIFNSLYPHWFGDGTEWSVVLTKVLFVLLIQTTLLTLPCAYVLKGLVEDNQTLQSALFKYISDIQERGLLTKNFMLWGPILCLTFTSVPEHWRVSFVALVSFFWIIILSAIAAAEPADAS